VHPFHAKGQKVVPSSFLEKKHKKLPFYYFNVHAYGVRFSACMCVFLHGCVWVPACSDDRPLSLSDRWCNRHNKSVATPSPAQHANAQEPAAQSVSATQGQSDSSPQVIPQQQGVSDAHCGWVSVSACASECVSVTDSACLFYCPWVHTLVCVCICVRTCAAGSIVFVHKRAGCKHNGWELGLQGLQGWPTARVSGWWQLAGETKSTIVGS